MKKLIFVFVLGAVILSLSHTLNPFDARLFSVHDDTQAARIQQMTLSLQQKQIPARLAPDLSHGLGFPIFNYYAPFAYYVATFMHLAGLSIPAVIKTSFFLCVVLSFMTMFLLLQKKFDFFSSLLGAVTYCSSLWFAIEIFIRGNLAECWFMVLFPLSLYLLLENSEKLQALTFFLTALCLSFLFSVHNIFSLLSIPITVVFIMLLKNKKRNIIALLTAICLASYFIVPSLLELHYTQASNIAKNTHYQDHFLCINQIWSSKNWEYGGSGKGCDSDGMPFTLGKIHIILGFAGIGLYILRLCFSQKKNKNNLLFGFILTLTITALFLTIYQSLVLWRLFEPLFAIFQFPWRFLIIGVFGLSFFTAYLSSYFEKSISYSKWGIVVLIFILLLTSKKFFTKPWLMTYGEYEKKYLEKPYIIRTVAYNMAEYLTSRANYDYWRSYDPQIYPDAFYHMDLTLGSAAEPPSAITQIKNEPFHKSFRVNYGTIVTLNIHYFPFWNISMNGKTINPLLFDNLGRPILVVSEPQTLITIDYKQTIIELISNFITISTLLFISVILVYKPLWTKIKHTLK